MFIKPIDDSKILFECRKIEDSVLNLNRSFPERMTSLPEAVLFDESFQNTEAFCEIIHLNVDSKTSLVQIKARNGEIKERVLIAIGESCQAWRTMRLDTSGDINFWEYGSDVFLYSMNGNFAAYWRADYPVIIFGKEKILLSDGSKDAAFSVEKMSGFLGDYFVSADDDKLAHLKSVFQANYAFNAQDNHI